MNSATAAAAYDPCDEKRSWRDQFACPEGWLGRLVGHFMAFNNRERSEWVVSLLDLRPKDRVLEIGFGPGADVRRVLDDAAFVAGVDHSRTMVRQALGRNREAVEAGRADLRHGFADQLPFEDAQFDRVFAINVAQFWRQPDAVAAGIRRVLKPGGLVCLAVQPRSKGATDAAAAQIGVKLAAVLRDGGFEDIRIESKKMKPVAAVCVSGRR